MAYDILIKGGRIYDGSGLPSYLGDVAVQDGKIVETGRINGSAKRVVNADGLAVSPGFIDFHTHLDAQLLWDPLATSSCYHGVTTVIPGNCGLSLAPCKEPDRDTILKSFERVEAITLPALKAGVKWGFTTFGQYLDAMRGNLGVNVASLVGHCALRQFVMGEASLERAATPAEIHQMKEVLKASVRAGAAGFSTNQNPVHMYADGTPIQSRFATDEEIIELACALGEINQGAVQISRGSLGVSVPMRESVKLFEEISSRSGRPVIWQSITHRWDKPNEWRDLLDLAKETIDRGVQSYPLCNARLFNNRLTMKNAQVFDDLPTWKTILFLPFEERIKAIKDPETRKKMRYEAVEENKSSRFSRRWDLVYLDQRRQTGKQAPGEEERGGDRQDPQPRRHRRLPRSVSGRRLGHRVPNFQHQRRRESGGGNHQQPLRAGRPVRRRRAFDLRRRFRLRDASVRLLGAREANHDGGRSRAQTDLHGRVDLRSAGPRPAAPRHGGRPVRLRSGDDPRMRRRKWCKTCRATRSASSKKPIGIEMTIVNGEVLVEKDKSHRRAAGNRARRRQRRTRCRRRRRREE